jgi:hypothetical protein
MEMLKSRGEYLTSDSYFRLKRNPLLMIYVINPNSKGDSLDQLTDFHGYPLVGFGIGIPSLTDAKTKYISYQINRIHQEFGGIEDYSDE